MAIETVAYPLWWDSAQQISVVNKDQGVAYTAARTSTELLPGGVSLDTGQFQLLIPWDNIREVIKVT